MVVFSTILLLLKMNEDISSGKNKMFIKFAKATQRASVPVKISKQAQGRSQRYCQIPKFLINRFWNIQ